MIEVLNTFSAHWWNYFIPLIIQNTLFLTVIFGALAALRKASAQTRYSIALLGLLKLLLPAFIPFSLLTIAPIGDPNRTLVLPPVVTAGSQATAVTLTVPALIMVAWLSIMIIMLAIPLFTLGRIKLHLRPAELIATQTISTNGQVRIYKTGSVTLPMTIGIFSKRIYVPLLWDQWSADHRELALRHELAHIKRHDGLTSGIQLLVQALYFFHPLVWLLNRQTDELREMACDEAAGGQPGTEALVYSHFLVDVAENMVRAQIDCPTANSLLKKKRELLKRVQYLLEDKMDNHRRITGILFPVLIGLALLFSWNCSSQTGKVIAPPEKKIPAQTATSEAEGPAPEVEFIEYDTPPEPVGGYTAILKNIVYPKPAVQARIEGTVVVQTYVNVNGKVTHTRILEGIPDSGLDEAAMTALKKTAFKPAQQDNQSVGVWVTVPVKFKLEEK